MQTLARVGAFLNFALLGGFLYVFFASKNLPYSARIRTLRLVYLFSIVVIVCMLWPPAALMADSFIPYAQGSILVLAMVLLIWKVPSVKRGSDPIWMKSYIAKLETELAERRVIERDLAFMASVGEQDPNCVIRLDANWRVTYRNPSAEQTFVDLESKGRTHPALVGLENVLSILQRESKTSLRRPFRYGDRVFEQQITWSAEAQSLSLYMTDVTEWKRLDELKTELLNTVSHEFRTPLSSILATTTMVLNEMLGPVTDDQKKMLSMMSHSAIRLNRLISDLLDISKIEAGKLELQRNEVNLEELVENVALSFRPLAQERQIELKTEISGEPLRCFADGDKIVQILTNLTNNALKFTSTGSITLSAHATATEFRCSVKDTGIGIPKEQLPKVFGKFQQFGAAVRGEKGSGLGLSLCKHLVELHQGKISLESQAGVGTTFTFVIPRISAQSVFNDAMRRMYEEAASAGRCFSAFVLALEEAPGTEAFQGKTEMAKALEDIVRKHFRSDRDMLIRQDARINFIIDGLDKAQATKLVEEIVVELIPLAKSSGAENQVVIRAQFTSLPDDGTFLEGLQNRLAA